MSGRKEEEKNARAVRRLMKLPPNRRCFNCGSPGPQYVCLDFFTFVCSSCSGIHQEFSHQVKSVSVAKFTNFEVEALQRGGNQCAREVFLKDWDMKNQKLPSGSDADKIREFMRSVYSEKIYTEGTTSSRSFNSSNCKLTEPAFSVDTVDIEGGPPAGARLTESFRPSSVRQSCARRHAGDQDVFHLLYIQPSSSQFGNLFTEMNRAPSASTSFDPNQPEASFLENGRRALSDISHHSGSSCFGKPDSNEQMSPEAAPKDFNASGFPTLALESSHNTCPGLVGATFTSKLQLKKNLVSHGCQSIEDLPPALLCEILHCLDAKELGIVSCVSTLLNTLASNHRGWKQFYFDRWGLPLPATIPRGLQLSDNKSWKELFVEREFKSKAFMGRYSVDMLPGHTEAVRSAFLLPSAKLIFTGGYDSVIRMWDMEDGLSVAASQPLGCTIRAIAADVSLLVAGGTDAFLQCWRAIEGHPHLFDISGFPTNLGADFRLWGHEGPVTCIALDSARIFSGSWDMSIRVWDRTNLNCVSVLWHDDWVWALVPCGSTVASTAGRDAYIWDIESTKLVSTICCAHSGNVQSLARSFSGDLLFTGGQDGAIHMFEVGNINDGDDYELIASWVPHSAAVNSLAFEFPWLVSCSSDGRLALMDVRKLFKPNRASLFKRNHKTCQSNTGSIEPPQRMLHGYGCNLFTVDIGADRIVCGGEEGVVRVWNFSHALEIEKRVQALKKVRLENRMRRRRIQVEKNSKGKRSDQCSVAAKRNNGDRSGVWHSKVGVAGKLKA